MKYLLLTERQVRAVKALAEAARGMSDVEFGLPIEREDAMTAALVEFDRAMPASLANLPHCNLEA